MRYPVKRKKERQYSQGIRVKPVAGGIEGFKKISVSAITSHAIPP